MTTHLRTGGFAAAAGATLAIAGNTLVLVSDPSVSDKTVSYPLSTGEFAAAQVWFALTQALMAYGIWALTRARSARSGRATGVLGTLAVVGMGLTVPGELLLIPVAGSDANGGAAAAASSVYGVAVLLTDVGLIGFGVLTRRRHALPVRLAVLALVLGAFQLLVVTPVALAAGFASGASYVVIAVADLLTALIGAVMVAQGHHPATRPVDAVGV